MIVAISGTPGTGKSTVAELAAKKLGYKVIEINDLLGIPYGKEVKVSIRKIRKKVSAELHNDTIIVSHLSHFLKDKRIKYFFILRCKPPILIKRLKERGYDDSKIYDNVMFEAIDGTYLEASRIHKNTVQIENTHDIKKTVNAIVSFMKDGKAPPKFDDDYSRYILGLERRFQK